MKRRFTTLGLLATLIAASATVSTGAFADTAPAAQGTTPYKVADGDKVDTQTLEGWHTWRALDCERCHGAQQQGLVGPSLIDGLKHLTKEQFEQTVLEGRPGTVMPSFKVSNTVTKNIDGLYAYLKGRSDGAIKPGHLYPIAN